MLDKFIEQVILNYSGLALIILILFLILRFINSDNFVNSMKYPFAARNRKIKRITESINLLDEINPLRKILEQEREKFILDNHFDAFLTAEKRELIQSVHCRVGDKIHFKCIVRAIGYLVKNDDDIVVRQFKWRDTANYCLVNIIAIAIIGMGCFIFFPLYISLNSDVLNWVPVPSNANELIAVIALFMASLGMMFIGMIFMTIGRPYKYAREIKQLFALEDSIVLSNQADSESAVIDATTDPELARSNEI